MDTFDSAVLNGADYSTGVKKLYRNYNNYNKLAHAGNVSALAIVLDLDRAFDELSNNQQFAIIEVLINGESVADVAFWHQSTSDRIKNYIKSGIKKTSKLLDSGKLYRLLTDIEEPHVLQM